jgi:hypothetical protein
MALQTDQVILLPKLQPYWLGLRSIKSKSY